MPARQSHSAKRRRVSPPADPVNHDEQQQSTSDDEALTSDNYNRISEWDLEAQYDSLVHKKAKKHAAEETRLPIKTTKGLVKPVAANQQEANDDGGSSSGGEEESRDAEKLREQQALAAEAAEEEEYQQRQKIPLKDQVVSTKEQLAHFAANINEDPDNNVPQFKLMLDMVTSKRSHPVIKKLVLAAMAAIYKDVIPGYRIRPLSDADKAAKTSKEVRQLRDFEQSLVSSYQKYVQELAILAKGKPDTKNGENAAPHDPDGGLKSVAVTCACNLLLSVPHFNFRTELLKILVHQLSHRQVTKEHVKCRETIEQIFEKDDDGVISMETVSLLAKMMKTRKFAIHDSTLDTFLHLRLLSELSVKGSNERTDAVEDGETKSGKQKAKQKKVFRTKKERKLAKEMKGVEKDMKEADALVSHEQRDKMQAETLKLVFGVYFRILKLHVPNLIGAVLEGLAKYAHLTNQDFFGDLLEAMRELIEQSSAPAEGDEDEEEYKATSTRNSTRESLLCAITAFALLEGQDTSKAASALHLDLSFFITHIYQTLYSSSLNPDIEYHPTKSLRLPDPSENGSNTSITSQQHKVNFRTPIVLLLRCLQSILLSKGIQAPPPIRVAAFTKRLMTMALQLPEKSATAIMSLLTQVSKQHGRKISPLWYTEERKGDGVYHGNAVTAETSNVYASTIWENELLKQHYCPQVRDLAVGVEGIIKTI